MKERKNYANEAVRLLEIIDELKLKKEKEYIFIQSIKAQVKSSQPFVSESAIFWLRDIKDRQLSD